MPLSFSEELLSAYLDGEVTPEEKQYVQRLLKEKPELQYRLNELAEVSLSVRELPREPAPDGFSQGILSHLQTQEVTQPASKKLATQRQGFQFRQWGSSLVAIAAVVIVGVFLVYQSRPNQELLVNQADQNAKMPAEMSMAESGDVLEETAFNMTDTSADVAVSDSVHLDIDGLKGMQSLPLPPADASLSASPGNATVEATNVLNAPEIVSLDRKTIQKHLSSLGESPSAGEEFSILASSGDVPILVDFTVVDVQKTLGTLQILLKNHSVEQVELKGKATLGKVGANDKLVAVYLDLEEPELENVLNQVVALNATIFIEEQRGFTNALGLDVKELSAAGLSEKEPFAEKNSPSPGSPRRMAAGNNPSAPNALGGLRRAATPQAARVKTSSPPTAAMKKSARSPSEQLQNFRFDFDSVRSSRRKDRGGSASSYADLQVGESKPATHLDTIKAIRPPTPQLPEAIENQSALSAVSKPSAVKQSLAKRSAAKTAPALMAEPPAENKERSPNRVRAYLILREENESKNPQ